MGPANFNAFAASPAAAAKASQRPSPTQMRAGHLVQTEPRLGVPTFLWVAEEDRGAPQSLPQEKGQRRLATEAIARGYLSRQAERYYLSKADVDAAEAASVHDTGRGAIIVKFKQSIGGVEVFRDEVKILMNRRLQLVAISGYLTGDSNRSEATSPSFRLPPPAAIVKALSDLTGKPIEASVLERASSPGGRKQDPYTLYRLRARPGDAVQMPEPARTKKVLFHLPDRYVPAYYVEVNVRVPDTDGGTTSQYYAYVISAADGEMLYRENLTVADSYSYRVWAEPSGLFRPFDGPQGNDPSPHPTGSPDFFNPPFVSPNNITLRNGPISTNDPWLPAATTETVGNNVDAYVDLAAPDGYDPVAGDFRAQPTAANAFLHNYDPLQDPTSNEQTQAAIQQLFFANNFFHDWFYDYGFDEASGNAQTLNFGRGGVEGDSLKAEVDHGASFNNANMATPSDGGRPRMQMFIFKPVAFGELQITSPASIAGLYTTGTANFGPQSFSLTSELVQVDDGSAPVIDGCQTPFANAAAVAGKIALVDRGNCTFQSKVLNAQANGAVGVIIVNSVAGDAPRMTGTCASCTIPVLSVTQAEGNSFKTALQTDTVTLTMSRQTVVNREGAIDNQIVAHEWGHYIAHRLINFSNHQGSSMSEGWSDFHSLLLTVRSEDAVVAANANYNGIYPYGSYAGGNGFNNSFYFGFRRVPYSTDFTKDPFTFKHIMDGVVLPTGVSYNPSTSGPNSEVHNSGEVWATMLWECYAALLRDTLGDSPRLIFAQAQDRMLGYLVAAYKITPTDPTYTEARDALLAAAFANDLIDFQLFAEAFARRGAGVGAVSPDRFSTDHAGVVESFVTGGDLSFVSAIVSDNPQSCDEDGVLDNNELGSISVTLKNSGVVNLSSSTATITSSNPAVQFPSGPTINFPASQPFQTTTASIPVRVTGLPGISALDFNISYVDPNFAVPGSRNASLLVRANYDDIPASSNADDVESNSVVWTLGHDPALDSSGPWERAVDTGLNYVWHGPDPSAGSDQYLISPALHVAAADDFTFTFRHRFEFEANTTDNFDGGVVEISDDNGASWTDIGSSLSPGYNGTLTAGVGNPNPLQGRQAYVGQSAGYPNYAVVTANLGTAFQGQIVKLRFRIGADNGTGATGWDIDDLAFNNITNTPFGLLVAEADPTCGGIDSDSDGMSDDFENFYGVNDPNLDPDGDGLTNLQEFRAGTNPLDPTSGLRITTIARNGSAFTVTFSLAVAGKAYRLERKDALTDPTWSSIAGLGDLTTTSTGAAQITDPAGTTLMMRFYHVRVLP